MKEQLEPIEEDGAALVRHRPSGFIGAIHHGGLCAGMVVTHRPGTGSLARMLASTALLGLPGAEFVTQPDPSGVYASSQWAVGPDSGNSPVWKTRGRQLLAGKSGSMAHPLVNPAGAGADTAFLVTIPIPAGLLHAGMRIYPRCRVRKIGAAAAVTLKMNIGTAGDATDALIASVTTATTSTRDVVLSSVLDVYDAATIFSEGLAVTNTDQASVVSDLTTNVNTAAQMFLSVSHNGNASDHFSLGAISLHLESLF